jgi:hypothetical protein
MRWRDVPKILRSEVGNASVCSGNSFEEFFLEKRSFRWTSRQSLSNSQDATDHILFEAVLNAHHFLWVLVPEHTALQIPKL